MQIPIYHVDAFTDRRFGGNAAAVMPLQTFPADAILQAIASENHLPVTAFLVRDGRDWRLRWFTPTTELTLCGHATLASAWAVTERLDPGCGRVVFRTTSGPLTVQRAGEKFVMDFPARPPRPIAAPVGLEAALGASPVEVLHDGLNLVAVLDSAATVRGLAPDLAAIGRLDAAGVIVTARGDRGYDCVSRYFAPALGIDEDAVAGSVHCALAPYWSPRLGLQQIRAYQASARGGEMVCRVKGERVELEGACVFYMEGKAEV
ncbi:MAG TPA: PhzF family phenazine biosynthesis protein [Thermoanaerobaculia bacterium]|jgi:PhzF family phenazine biosynthesis protein|nr:PhzF family phenazine biosynthesis protein [Thermoanaerobaculia bacterium]